MQKPEDPAEQEDLGVLLLRFLKFYGQEFNYHNTGISVRDGGSYFSKIERCPC
jgi:non-canonical poly(A) RNA polymerase PAPD5/7